MCVPTKTEQRSLRRAIRTIIIPFQIAARARGSEARWPNPLIAAANRRCPDASTNELLTDIMGSETAPPIPRLRLGGADYPPKAQHQLGASMRAGC